jgi:excisionase family DNA binding protein
MTTSVGCEYLSAPRVAELLGVGHDRVLAWIHSGELRAANVAVKVGGRPRRRVSEDDLQAFLARRSGQSPPRIRRRRQRPENIVEYY